MNAIFLVRRFALYAGLVCLAGCAAESPKSQSRATPVREEKKTSEARDPAVEEMYKQAAAKPSLPFEDDDWQSLFDGQTLKGWSETQFAGRGEVQCRSGLMVLKD